MADEWASLAVPVESATTDWGAIGDEIKFDQVDIPEKKASLQTFYYPETPENTRKAGLSYSMEGGVQGGAGFSDIDLRNHTLEKYQSGESPFVAVAMAGKPTGELFKTVVNGQTVIAKQVDTGGGLRVGQIDVATSNPELAKHGVARNGVSTGKPVKLEAMYDVPLTPVQTLQTRRAQPVHPEDQPWDSVAEPIESKTPEVPTMEQQTVAPEVVDPSIATKVGTALYDWVAGMVPKDKEELLRSTGIPSDWTNPEQLARFMLPQLRATIDTARQVEARTKQISAAEQTAPYSQERFTAGIGTALDLASLASIKGLTRSIPRSAMGPNLKALGPSIDELITRRVQKPWEAPGVTDAGDIIDVPFVRMDEGTLGDRVSAMFTPAEGQRPAQGILLKPGEPVPRPLIGYPEIQHDDGTRTIFRPEQPVAASEQAPIEIYDESEAFPTGEFEEVPTPEDLSLPTMSSKEFDNYLGDLSKQSQIDQAHEYGSFMTPVMDYIGTVGGLISKSQAKKTGLYDKAGAALWDDVPKQLTSVDMRHLWNGTETPDNMAQNLYNDGLIPQPTVGAMWNAWQQERDTLQGIKSAPSKPEGFQSEIPSPNEVLRNFEELGLNDDERLIVHGKHYIVANPITGEIRQLFPTREEAFNYLQNEAGPGDALVLRAPRQPDKLVAKRPDDVFTLEQQEIKNAEKRLGRTPKTGKDWDEYLSKQEETPDLFPAEEQSFNLMGEPLTQEASAEGLARRQAESQYAQEKAQTKMKFKGKGEAGAMGLGHVQPIAKAIVRGQQMRAFKDNVLAKEGAVRNLSSVYARQRGNIIRRDFGTVKDALRKGTRPYRDLEALTAIDEAGRNKARLAEHRKLVASSKKIAMAKKWTPVWDYALREFDRISAMPDKLRDEMNRQIAWEAYRGVDMGYTPNYVPHLFAEDPKGIFGGFFKIGTGGNALPRWFTKTRQYNSLAEAIHEGENPRSVNAADLAEGRIRAGKRLVLGKDYVSALERYPMPDGKPALSVKDVRGYVPIEVYGTKIWAHPEAASYMDVLFDTSAIRKSAVGRGVLKTAGIIKQGKLALDTFHAVRLSSYLAGAGKGITRLPRSGYRRGLATLELSPEQYKQAIASGEYSPAEVQYAQANRPLMIELLGQGAEVSQWADNLSQQMHSLIPGTKHVNSFIFDSLGRGALMTALLENYKRNLARFPELSRAKAARRTVIEMNEMFGNPGRKIFKSKTFQDMMQTLMLAPNWVLTQVLNEGRAYAQMAGYPINVIEGVARGQGMKSFTRLGATAQSRLALAGGLLMLAEVLNLAFNGETMDKNPEGHKFHAKIPAGTMGLSKDYYFDPAQIPFEFTHQVAKYLRKGEGPMGTAMHIMDNKLSSLFRAGRGAAQYASTGQMQTYRGGPTARSGPEAARLIASELMPVPIMAGGVLEPEPRSNLLFRSTRRPDALAIQAAASGGVKLEPEETARQQMYVKAQKFRRPEDAGIPIQGNYSQLKHALENRDRGAVEQEIALLMKAAPTRADRAKMFDNIHKSLGIGKDNRVLPTYFTHSKEAEQKMQRELKPEERSLYRQAQMEHDRMVRYYLLMEPRLKRLILSNAKGY